VSKEEKLLILQMVSDGKVTPEEGVELLRAVAGGAGAAESQQALSENLATSIREGVKRSVETAVRSAEEVAEGAATEAERVAADVERHVARIGESAGIQREVVGENIEESLTGLGKTIARMFRRGFGAGGPQREFHEEFCGEFPEQGTLDVGLSTANGRVTVKTWDRPGFHLDVQKRVNADSDAEAENLTKDVFTFTSEGNVLRARSKEPQYGWCGSVTVSFTLTLPKDRKASLDLASSNGRITIQGVSGPRLSGRTANGRIIVDDCSFDTCDVNTANGRIEYEGQAKELTADTANGRIVANIEGAGNWRLDSANGRIEVNIKKTQGVGYEVDTSAVMGRIQVSGFEDVIIDETRHKTGARRYKARSLGFDEAECKATLRASTAMGRVIVSA
jgi:DUF4097 and DUF4098 domain-containing protein YvlB